MAGFWTARQRLGHCNAARESCQYRRKTGGARPLRIPWGVENRERKAAIALRAAVFQGLQGATRVKRGCWSRNAGAYNRVQMVESQRTRRALLLPGEGDRARGQNAHDSPLNDSARCGHFEALTIGSSRPPYLGGGGPAHGMITPGSPRKCVSVVTNCASDTRAVA